MHGNPKVSVIVPIYNVEKYLRQCLDSILKQTLKDIEIICVDDGSPDNCAEIIDEYAAKDSRIVPVHKENGGYASAINYGLNIAKGEYIGIVESDDWIAEDMYEKLYIKALDTNSDIVKASCYFVSNSKTGKKSPNNKLISMWKKHESFCFQMDAEILLSYTSIWSAIYKRDWLNECSIRIPEDIRPYEDLPFLALVYSFARKITLIPDSLYYYRLDAVNSSGNTVKPSILNYVPQRAKVREIFIANNCFSENVMEYYWKSAYQGLTYYINKPNNKYKSKFYVLMRELLQKTKQDGCKFIHFSRKEKKNVNIILTFSYHQYIFVTKFLKLLKNLFSVSNNKGHKLVRFLGFKIKFSKDITKNATIIRFFDRCLPKDKNKIVFMSYPDYSDNSKALFEHIYKNYSNEFKLVWLCRNPENYSIPVRKRKMTSLLGVWDFLTAKYCVNTFFSLESCMNSNERIKLQLWHGMPLKTVGYLEKNIPAYTIQMYSMYRDAYFFVTSDIFKLSMASSFLANPNNVYVTGQPRNDLVFSSVKGSKISEFLSLHKFSKVVLYTPTYKEQARGGQKDIDKEFNNIFYFDDYSKDSLFRLLEELNILLVIKPHPFEEKFYRKLAKNGEFDHPNIKVVYNSDMKENDFYFYEFFQFADLMITDFSSIGIDYLITKKPIIFLNSLADQYNKNRGFVLEDNHEIIMPGEKVYNFYELISAIRDSLTFDSWKERRLKMLPLLHKYTDANSSERVYRIMKELK